MRFFSVTFRVKFFFLRTRDSIAERKAHRPFRCDDIFELQFEFIFGDDLEFANDLLNFGILI